MNSTHNPPGRVGPPPLLTRLDSLTSLVTGSGLYRPAAEYWVVVCFGSSFLVVDFSWLTLLSVQDYLSLALPPLKGHICLYFQHLGELLSTIVWSSPCQPIWIHGSANNVLMFGQFALLPSQSDSYSTGPISLDHPCMVDFAGVEDNYYWSGPSV